MDIKTQVISQLERVRKTLEDNQLAEGEMLYQNGACQILTQSARGFELWVEGGISAEYALFWEEDQLWPVLKGHQIAWDQYSFACMLEVENELRLLDPRELPEHKKYSREGMIRRVMQERRQKADKAHYQIKWAGNIYGDHILTNEFGKKYKIFLRDFDQEIGYSDSMDSRLNKLGTTKHLMYAFRRIKENPEMFQSLSRRFPFIEIFCDPLNEYRVSWYYPYPMPMAEEKLIHSYFSGASFLPDDQLKPLLRFFSEAEGVGLIRIRPEVREKVEAIFEREMLLELKEKTKLDFSGIKADLFPYQKEGIEFATFRKTAIIADEMGLGKTVQAIGVAIQKKKVFGFNKVLVISPASLKEQWKKEIERFSEEKAIIVDGPPAERKLLYQKEDTFFFLVNYETILRDQVVIGQSGFGFLILDEAQRIKNFETKTAGAIARLHFPHSLVITGTPIENRLIDIFSIVGALDPHFFGPLWEFSFQHCLFDPDKPNKINGYFNLPLLNQKLGSILIRREKRKVLDQLPDVVQVNVPVPLTPLQQDYHSSYARGIASILRKKYFTPYDLHRLQLLLTSMRMVCDSSYLVDEETHDSPKLEELRYMLLEKFDVLNSPKKIIIFSEWVKMHKLIGHMLREIGVGFVELNGSIPVKQRGELIRKFETNPHCQVFLSTEAGGSGLNLQVADTLINIELPWNPAKKNQRIGRMDRLGQLSSSLSVFNFISRNSIEQRIAAGLIVKQNLFDGVLDMDSTTEMVDFSTKGRAQFIQELEEYLASQEFFPGFDGGEEGLSGEPGLSEMASSEIPGDPDPVREPVEYFPNPEIEKFVPVEDHGPKVEPAPAHEMEQVMNQGMQFLAGLFKISTGKDLGLQNQSVEINTETGEVILKFKLPV